MIFFSKLNLCCFHSLNNGDILLCSDNKNLNLQNEFAPFNILKFLNQNIDDEIAKSDIISLFLFLSQEIEGEKIKDIVGEDFSQEEIGLEGERDLNSKKPKKARRRKKLHISISLPIDENGRIGVMNYEKKQFDSDNMSDNFFSLFICFDSGKVLRMELLKKEYSFLKTVLDEARKKALEEERLEKEEL